MTTFNYIDDGLHAEDVPLSRIVAGVGTPCYVYSSRQIVENYNRYRCAFDGMPHLVCYSLKANSNLAVIRLLSQLDAGFDSVSGGEIAKALAGGARPERIVFSGVGKTRAEMQQGLEAGIRQFNIESIPELELLNTTARSMGMTASVALRINPDVDARTHEKISTGMAGNKFGIDIQDVSHACELVHRLENLDLVGLDIHIGSQIMSLEPFRKAFTRVAELVQHLRTSGHAIGQLDIGGGLGVTYRHDDDRPPSHEDYALLVGEILGPLGCEILLEPGRSIVSNAGILISTVIYRKKGTGREFLVIDAAMNDLLRPAMYDAHHELVPVTKPGSGHTMTRIDVVGPVCESSDTFARQRMLPGLEPGDEVAFMDAGAYGATMSSEYNCRPLVPEVMVEGDKWSVIRPRPSHTDMINRDIIPPWMENAHQSP